MNKILDLIGSNDTSIDTSGLLNMISKSRAGLHESLQDTLQGSVRAKQPTRQQNVPVDTKTSSESILSNDKSTSGNKYGVNDKLWNIVNPYIDRYKLGVIQGYRDKATAGKNSAKNSQHYLGNAIDLNYSQLDTPTRIKLIRELRNAGIGGLGMGNNTLHADIGDTRHWTYNNGGQWISGQPTWFPGF